MDYAQILTQAWAYLKRYKALWPFGLLASCSGHFSFNLNLPQPFQPSFPTLTPPHTLPGPWRQKIWRLEAFFRHLDERQWALLAVGLTLVLLGWALTVWALNRWGVAAILRSDALTDPTAPPLPLRTTAQEGLLYAGRLLLADGVALAVGLVGMAILTALSLGLAVITLGIGLILLACLLWPAAWLLRLYLRLVQLTLTHEEEVPLLQSFGQAWEVLTHRLGEWIALGLILDLMGLVVQGAIVLPALGLGGGLAYSLFQGKTALLLPLGLALGFYLLLGAWPLQGLWKTYTLHAWALAYRQHEAPLPSA